jgi:diguanylate cyclase (GGDEF)-like protein
MPVGQQGMSLVRAGVSLALCAVAVSAIAAWTLAHWLPSALWAAPLAAVLGLAAGALPTGWLLARVVHGVGSAPGTGGRGDVDAAPAAGVSRELFLDLAEREFARARRYGTGAALLLVDLDRHTRLCEARGLAAGEAALAELLRSTAPTLRTADVLALFGPAQVAVFLAHADATGALDVAERIRERSEQMSVVLPGNEAVQLRITVSAGVAHLRPAHLGLAALIDDAQDAVAAARQAGGNCVRAAPVDAGSGGQPGTWRERRARPKSQPPRQGGNG